MARTKKVGVTGRFGTGGAYLPSTPMGKTAARNIKRIVGGL